MNDYLSGNMIIKDLEIQLIHIGQNGLRSAYGDVLLNPFSILVEDVLEEEANPIAPTAGLKMFCDKIFCFLNVEGAEDVDSYISFLATSLLALMDAPGQYADYLPIDAIFEYSSVIGKVYEGGDGAIVLCRKEQGVLSLNYVNNVDVVIQDRKHKFFKSLAISENVWIDAAKTAIDEYVQVVEKCIYPLYNNFNIPPNRLAPIAQNLDLCRFILNTYSSPFSSHPHS